MIDYIECAELMERVIHKYNQTESRKLDYGTGEKLTRKEIHTINAIGNSPAINITELAKIQGVTKGAVSQMVYKLVDKGYIEKRVSPESDAEVCLELTKLGLIAYRAHKEYHKKTQEEFFTILKNMPEDTYNNMVNLVKSFEQSLDNKLNEK